MTERPPSEDERWCEERRRQVTEYLRHEGLRHGRIGEWPAWHLAPHVSIWAIESVAAPGLVGWWAICGDGPTDYMTAGRVRHPREALRAFAARWAEIASYMERGEPHPTIDMGSPRTWQELWPLLGERAELLRASADDDSVWQPAP